MKKSEVDIKEYEVDIEKSEGDINKSEVDRGQLFLVTSFKNKQKLFHQRVHT